MYAKASRYISPTGSKGESNIFFLYKSKHRPSDMLFTSIHTALLTFPARPKAHAAPVYVITTEANTGLRFVTSSHEPSLKLIDKISEELKWLELEIGSVDIDKPSFNMYQLHVVSPNTKQSFVIRFKYNDLIEKEDSIEIRAHIPWNSDSDSFERMVKEYATVLAAVLEALYRQSDTPLPSQEESTIRLEI